jgi:RIO-like serine/threonine protein kinase
VEHSEEEAEVWASTHLRAFGSYAHVRKASRSSFPMCKIAYCTEASLFFIRNEFQILQQLRSSALPIVKVGDPLIDENGIFGFTMEELHPIKPEDIPLYYKDMKDALDKVHKQGYVHADVTVSNFMQTDEGNVRIIDFGQAGNDGEPLPKQHPLLKLGKQKFEVDMDFEGLERIKQRVGWIESTS